VYTSLEEQSLSQEDSYPCPFYIPSSNYHPLYTLSNLLQFPFDRNQSFPFTEEVDPSNSNNTSVRQDNPALSCYDRLGLYEEQRNEKQPIQYIPVHTLEDKIDCKLNRISLISCPSFLLPHS
jgi:hypothetical protein